MGIPNRFGAGLPTVDAKLLGRKPKPDPRDEAVPVGGGFGELGSGYDRIVMAADRLGIGLGGDAAKLEEISATLKRMEGKMPANQSEGPREKRDWDE